MSATEQYRTTIANTLIDLARAVRRGTLSQFIGENALADVDVDDDDDEDAALRKRIIREYGELLQDELKDEDDELVENAPL